MRTTRSIKQSRAIRAALLAYGVYRMTFKKAPFKLSSLSPVLVNRFQAGIYGFHDLDHFRIGLILLIDETDIEIFVVLASGNGLIVIRKPARANK